MWNNKEFYEFSKYVHANYDVMEDDTYKMVMEEYKDRLNLHARVTRFTKDTIIKSVIDDCKVWLNEERRQLKPSDLISYRITKLWFNSIEKRNCDGKNMEKI